MDSVPNDTPTVAVTRDLLRWLSTQDETTIRHALRDMAYGDAQTWGVE